MLLQNGIGALLEIVAMVYYKNMTGFFITKCDILLQNATVIRECDVYYNMRWESSIFEKKNI